MSVIPDDLPEWRIFDAEVCSNWTRVLVKGRRLAEAYAAECVAEALANTTAEQLQEEAIRAGTLFGTPIADLQAISHLTRELNIPIGKLREQVEALADPLALIRDLVFWATHTPSGGEYKKKREVLEAAELLLGKGDAR